MTGSAPVAPARMPPTDNPQRSPSTRWIDAVDVRLGVALAALGLACGGVYVALTWGQPHRAAMAALLGLGLLSGIAVQLGTKRLLLNPRLAVVFFPAWSVAYIAMIATLSALDGMSTSPVRAFFVVPVVFAALAYPLRPAALVAVTAVLTFGGLVLADGDRGAGAVLVGGALVCAAMLGIRQARVQASRQEELTEQRDSLRESELRFRGGFEHSPVGMVLIAPDGRYMEVNDALCRMLGRSREELERAGFRDVTHPEDRPFEEGLLERFAAGELDHVEYEKRYVTPAGDVVHARVADTVIRDADGAPRVIHTQAVDVTAQRQAARRAHRGAAQQAAVAALGQAALEGRPLGELLEETAEAVCAGLETPYSGVLELTPEGRVATAAVRGWEAGRTMPVGSGQSQTGLCFATAAPVLMRDARTEERFVASGALDRGLISGVMVPVPGQRGAPFGVIGAHATVPDAFDPDDVSFLQALANVLGGALGRDAAEQRLRHQSLHDSLTGLPNRPLLLDRLGHALSRTARGDEVVGVLFLDVDHFKTVNDAFGHDAGDELLRVLTPRLQRALRAGDTLARFGGDEFVVLCEGLRDAPDAVVLAERLLAVFDEPFALGREGGHPTEHHLSGSIGVAVAGPEHVDDPQALIRDADAAMYRAKRGRGRVEVFDQRTREQILARVRTTGELRRALENDELSLVYQPIVGLADGSVRGVEALLRWDHPTRGRVSPGEFIPLAEESGLILPVGEWVLENVLAQLAEWDADGDPRLHGLGSAINLSQRQLAEAGLPELVQHALERHGIEAGRLVCEITETALIDDPVRAAETVEALHAHGVGISLDDFCTGYSALEHLKRFPLAAIKLDQTFVSEIATNPVDWAIVRGLVEIATAMGLSTIAEGVETTEQLSRLREVGCELAQGFLLAAPLPPAELVRYLRALPPAGALAVAV